MINSNSDIVRVQLKDICERISSGGTPSRSRPDYFVADSDGHLWVKSKELLDCSISDTEEKISEDGLQNSSAKYYPAHSILMAMYGANVCQLGWLRQPATVNQAICGMVVDRNVADYRYVFYALLHCRGGLAARARGAAQQNLSQDLIREFWIPLPSLQVQSKIGSILCAYDDLIEKNTRRIRILEEMAQAIYREWFVHFRFPGHEKVKLVDSPLGKIPEGWSVATLSACSELSRDSINPTLFPEERFAHFSIPAFDQGRMPSLEAGKAIRSSKFLVVPKSVLISKLNPRVPRVWMPEWDISCRAIASTEFLILTPKHPFTRELLYSLFQTQGFIGSFAGRAIGTSTSHQRVKPQDALGMPVVKPDPVAAERFTSQVTPTLGLAHNLRLKNANLRQTRDLLLPKLISGQVDVSDLEIEVGEGL